MIEAARDHLAVEIAEDDFDIRDDEAVGHSALRERLPKPGEEECDQILALQVDHEPLVDMRGLEESAFRAADDEGAGDEHALLLHPEARRLPPS